MKKYIVYITFIATLFSMSSRAQVRFGIQAGWNVNKVTWKWKQLKENIKSDNRNGFFAGVTLDVTVPIVGLGVDFAVLYDNRVVAVPTSYEDVNKTMEYIVVPVNLRYSIGFGDFLNIYGATGPQVSYNIGDRSWILDDRFLTAWTSGWEISKSDLSWNIGGGFTLFNHIRLGYNYNIMLGHTNEFTIRRVGGYIERGTLKDNAHQISFTYFF